jgi:prepilin-type N-terminal cleavage/methylation domain-containing protein
MIRRHASRHSGFSIPEILVALGLLVIFMAMTGPLFRSVFQTTSEAAKTSDRSAQLDAAVNAIRRDVWDSRAILLKDPRHVEMTASDGHMVFWNLSPDGTIKRQAGGAASWGPGKGKFTFSADQMSVTLAEEKSSGPQGVRLISQVLLAGGGGK